GETEVPDGAPPAGREVYRRADRPTGWAIEQPEAEPARVDESVADIFEHVDRLGGNSGAAATLPAGEMEAFERLEVPTEARPIRVSNDSAFGLDLALPAP